MESRSHQCSGPLMKELSTQRKRSNRVVYLPLDFHTTNCAGGCVETLVYGQSRLREKCFSFTFSSHDCNFIALFCLSVFTD